VRSTNLPDGETLKGQQHVGKGSNWEVVYQSLAPKTWVIWSRLDCFKPSGSWCQGRPRHNDSCRASYRSNLLKPGCELSRREHGVMNPIKPRTGTYSHPIEVTYDCTTGLPTGRESYGNGDPIVVVGVTPHQGGCDIKQPQGEGGQGLKALRIRRYA
jgi:hypothetical protein